MKVSTLLRRGHAVLLALLLAACDQFGLSSSQTETDPVEYTPAGPVGTWDVRWEGPTTITASAVPMYAYLTITETGTGLEATLDNEPLILRIAGNNIEFSYDQALRSETGSRMGQLTLNFSGVITGDRIQGTVQRTDGITGRRQTGRWGDMITVSPDAAPGFLPETLAQADMVAVGFKNLSDVWSASRVLPRKEIDISGVWKPRREMGNEWLMEFEALLTDEAIQRRNEWRPYDAPELRCASSGMIKISGWPMPFDIVQSGRVVAMIYEGEGAARRIHTDGREIPEDWLESGMGYSVGSWNGDVLEVTTRLLSANLIAARGVEHRGEQTIVTEKISMTNDGLFLRMETVIDDPLTYSRPLRRLTIWEKDMTAELVPYECDGYTFFRGLHFDGRAEEYFSAFPKY